MGIDKSVIGSRRGMISVGNKAMDKKDTQSSCGFLCLFCIAREFANYQNQHQLKSKNNIAIKSHHNL